MNTIFMNFSWILFPIMTFLIYEAYSENRNKKQNETFLNFCLISIIYLIIRCGTFENYKRTIEIMLDTIIITLYLRKYDKAAVTISIISVIILLNFKLEIIIVKYIMYYYADKIYKNKQTYNIILIYIIRLFSIITTILCINISTNNIFYKSRENNRNTYNIQRINERM